jgi:hypothetical protein
VTSFLRRIQKLLLATIIFMAPLGLCLALLPLGCATRPLAQRAPVYAAAAEASETVDAAMKRWAANYNDREDRLKERAKEGDWFDVRRAMIREVGTVNGLLLTYQLEYRTALDEWLKLKAGKPKPSPEELEHFSARFRAAGQRLLAEIAPFIQP